MRRRLAALGFLAAFALVTVGLERVLRAVLPATAMRALLVHVFFAGKVVHARPRVGAPGVTVSYGFLGHEAVEDALIVAIAVAAFLYVRRAVPRPFAVDREALVFTAKLAAALGAVFAIAGAVGGLVAARVADGAPLRDFLERLDMPLLTDRVGVLLVASGFLVAAPIAEELVFRGFIYRALRERLSVPGAAILQATLFGLCHVNTGLAPVLIAIPYAWGIAAALLYERTGSVGAAVLLHAVGNAIGLGVVALVMRAPAEAYALFGGAYR